MGGTDGGDYSGMKHLERMMMMMMMMRRRRRRMMMMMIMVNMMMMMNMTMGVMVGIGDEYDDECCYDD